MVKSILPATKIMIIARTTEAFSVQIPEATAERIKNIISDSGQFLRAWLDTQLNDWAIGFEYRKDGRTERDFVRLEK